MMSALRSRCALRLALAAIVAVRGADAQGCLTANAYDTANGVGACDGLIASGYPCDATFSSGQAYSGYCDLSCGYNYYDGSQGVGACRRAP